MIAGVVGALGWQATRPPAVEAALVENMAFPLPDRPSIAVLPFVNLSGDTAQEFLADGISEDILTALSKLSEFFVISRTTTATYKGKDVTVKEVAEDLGVRYVLEGSVQRDGGTMRVTAQLIDALSGQHIWADRYDRDVADLFAVKDEITLNIVSSIGTEIGLGEYDRLAFGDTRNLQAWTLNREGTGRIIDSPRTAFREAANLLRPRWKSTLISRWPERIWRTATCMMRDTVLSMTRPHHFRLP